MKLEQARVVLTGASGGIGRAAARALADAGAAVLLVGRTPARLETQARELARGGTLPITWHATDLLQADQLASLARAAACLRANVVVHAAGMPSFGRLETLVPADLQRMLHTNLLAPMWLTQALLPQLRRQAQARLVFVGSALGHIGLPGFSAYAAAKFGLRGFAEALRRELGDGPVRVQYLAPRSTRTAFNGAAVEAYNAATGTAMDAPEVVSRALLQLLRDDRAERFIGWPERMAVRLNGLAPTWLDGAFKRHRRCLPDAGSPSATPVASNVR